MENTMKMYVTADEPRSMTISGESIYNSIIDGLVHGTII